jgi:hypothetical protein
MSNVTRILSQIVKGDPTVAGQQMPFVDDELRNYWRRSGWRTKSPGKGGIIPAPREARASETTLI